MKSGFSTAGASESGKSEPPTMSTLWGEFPGRGYPQVIFSTAEIELLRLAGWFKGLPSSLSERFGSSIFAPAGIGALEALHLLYHSRERRQYRLTPLGWAFLAGIGFPYPQDAKYVSDPAKTRRREQAAKVMFTFHQAGFDVFRDRLEDLNRPGVFLSTEAMQRSLRRQNTKVWNGLRMCGVGRLGTCGCLVHFTDQRGMYFVNEMTRFRQAAAGCSQIISVYAADRYTDAAWWLLHEPPAGETKHKRDWTSFCTAAKMVQMPLHLLECSDAGAVQLLVMGTPDYRERIARLVLSNAYRPPPSGLPDTDATLDGIPLVVAMDMDIKRLQRACQTAFGAGLSRLSIVAFPEQLETLAELFGATGQVDFYQVEKEQVSDALKLRLHAPGREPFGRKEGGYLDVSDIPKRKKAGRPSAAALAEKGGSGIGLG